MGATNSRIAPKKKINLREKLAAAAKKELGSGFRGQGWRNSTTYKWLTIFDECDVDRSGTITYDELAAFVLPISDNIKEWWSLAVDGGGFTRDKFLELLEYYPEQCGRMAHRYAELKPTREQLRSYVTVNFAGSSIRAPGLYDEACGPLLVNGVKVGHMRAMGMWDKIEAYKGSVPNPWQGDIFADVDGWALRVGSVMRGFEGDTSSPQEQWAMRVSITEWQVPSNPPEQQPPAVWHADLASMDYPEAPPLNNHHDSAIGPLSVFIDGRRIVVGTLRAFSEAEISNRDRLVKLYAPLSLSAPNHIACRPRIASSTLLVPSGAHVCFSRLARAGRLRYAAQSGRMTCRSWT